MTRREMLYPDVVHMREVEGLMWREIGERLGLSLQMASEIYHDPTGEKARARKAKNDGVCVDCGVPTKSGGAKVPPERCLPCNLARVASEAKWTRETVIARIQRWADENGGVPPTATEWRHVGDGDFPPTSTVQDVFGGSWNDAISAAGYEPFAMGNYGRDGELPEVIEETMRLHDSGVTLAEIARRMGVSGSCVLYRLKKAGYTPRPARPWRHGTRYGYDRMGCGCAECLTVGRAYGRERSQRARDRKKAAA